MKVSRALPWLTGLLLAAALSSAAEAACRMKQIARVRVEITDSGSVLVPATVNGTPVWMMLHMSSGIPIAYESTVQSVGLKTFPAEDAAARIGSAQFGRQTIADTLTIGGVNLSQWEMYVVPGLVQAAPVVTGRPVLGTLSSRFATAVDIELNLAQQEIALFEHARCGNEAVHWGGVVTSADIHDDGSGLLVFPLEIDGRRIEASLNTNEGTSVISEEVTSRYFGFDRNSKGLERRVQDGEEAASYRAMALTTRGLQMSNVRVRLQEDEGKNCDPRANQRYSNAIGFERCTSTAPLSIGTNLLRKLRIYVASKEGKIYFTQATEPPAATP